MLAIQPWRARMSAQFKASRILAPLARSLRPGGRLLTVQSYGQDPALEIVQRLWPGENPFQVGRHDLVQALTAELGADLEKFSTQRDRIESVDLYQVPERLGSVPPDTVVCVRSHRLPKFDRFFVNRPLPFAVTPDGEYHLYLVRELIDAIR